MIPQAVISAEAGSLMVPGTRGGIRQGLYPMQVWNPEKPVDALIKFIMLKQMIGNVQTQPF
jgi:hypothetical protein